MTTSSKSSRFPLLRWGCSATAIGCVLFLNPNLAQAGTALVSNPSNDSTATGTTTFEPPTAGTSFDGVAGVTTETTGEGATLTSRPESSAQSATALIDFNGAESVSLVIVNNDNTSYSAADAEVTVSPTKQGIDASGRTAVLEQIINRTISAEEIDLTTDNGNTILGPLRGALNGNAFFLGSDTTLGSGGALLTSSYAVVNAIQQAMSEVNQELPRPLAAGNVTVLETSSSSIFSDQRTAQAVQTFISLTVSGTSTDLVGSPLMRTLVPTALNDALAAVAAYITSQGGPESVSPEVRAISNILMQVKRDTVPELSAPAAEGGESGESGEDEA